MSWNLQIIPKGLILSKYIRNIILLNPNNFQNTAYNQLESDQFQAYNASNNTANLYFQFYLYNTDPRNQESQPNIVSINYIIVSNDPNFDLIYILTPSAFSSAYNLQTNYTLNLSSYNVSSVTLPASQGVTFTINSNGSGLIIIQNWPLSGSSGLKRVFFSVNVSLSDGTNASYPSGFNVFDEITVCSNYIASPNVPQIIGKTPNNYTSYPLYYSSRIASNSGVLSINDYGVASYFWDSLILNSPQNIIRNNYSQNNIQLFKTSTVKSLNAENLPIVFTQSVSTGIAGTAVYNTYTTASAFKLSTTNNIYFFEAFVNNYTDTYGYEFGPSFFYEFNITNSSGTIKYLRQQLIFDETFTTLTVITSLDDSTWSTDTSYIPSALNQTLIITNPDVVAQLTQSGVYLLLVELIDSVNNIYQSKLIFKPDSFINSFVINETLFTSNNLVSNTNIYAQFRSFIRNTTGTVILESTQYGLCQGTISACVMPNDKILTNNQLNVKNNIVNFYNSEALNTWFVISNSPSSGVLNSDGTSVYLFNNQINDSHNNLSAIEIQSNVPTFSEDSTLTATFSILSSSSAIKTGFSTDSNLNYSNFTFSDLLKTSGGLTLPQQNSVYDLIASLNWYGTNQFSLNVYDVGSAQTCSISTTLTNNLFFYSQSNNLGILQPPLIIKTVSSISSSDTFSAWIGTNGFSTSSILNQAVTIKNQGNVPIAINTGYGLNTIGPGQPYVVTSLSYQTSAPTSFIITTQNSTVTSGVNFLYDFGQPGTINQIGISIQITSPPDCPATLPSIQYSIEISQDFITWIYLTNSSATQTFSPNTGNIILVFLTPNNAGDTNFYRYLRLRIYKNAGATFDPTKTWKYSSFTGQQIPQLLSTTTGKLIFGFTDTNALNSSLGQLYDQPTYLRKYLTNSTTVLGIVFDFVDYQTSNNVFGPVYLNLLTQSGENRFYTITNNFQLSTQYQISFTIQRSTLDNAFKLQPNISLTGIGNSTININLSDIITEPSVTQSISFGYYPFISLVGNGNINVSSSVFSGTYNHGLSYPNDRTYFSLLSAENTDYTANYGKNILSQNTYGISTYNFPLVNYYFSYNQIQNFDYSNVTFTVFAVATLPIGLYGLAYVDGVYLAVCDFILVTGQFDKTTNGIYQVQLQQWVKQNANPNYPTPLEPTILVSQGNIFGDTLWMQDNVSTDWIPNTVVCPVVLNNNNLLFTGVASNYIYPQYIKLAVGVNTTTTIDSLDQVKIKLVNSPNGYISDTDSVTQWNSLLQNGQLNTLREKSNANNTVFMNFSFSTSQIQGISTNFFPAIYNMVVAYSGAYSVSATQNSNFVLPTYGSIYRMFNNSNLIYQLYSFYEKVNLGIVNSSIVDSALYALNVAGVKSPQSGYSTDIYIDTLSPTLGILSYISDNVKSITLGLSSALDTTSGLALARIVQKNPSNELIYSTWFGFTTSSFAGISTFTVYPSYITNYQGLTTGEPLSGYYRYSLQVADYVGNVSQTNQIENFYYESVLVDTQGPTGNVAFVASNNVTPISINSSAILTAQLFVSDVLTSVKAYRFRILPNGQFGNWIDFDNYADIYLPATIADGILSIQFQFKDFGNNVLYQDDTIPNEQTYIYTWNIVSGLINNVLFTVTETATYNGSPVLIIGASSQNMATIYLWNVSQLIQLQYSGFIGCKAITALLNVNGQVLIGTDNGSIFIYQNGIITGPYAQLQWGGSNLPISKFALQQYVTDSVQYVYATTLKIPRIFRTPVTSLDNLSWQVIQPNPVSVVQVNVLNTGLWSGSQIYYSISSSYQSAVLTPNINYGISSVIINNPGSNLTNIPTITLIGPIVGASLLPIMQGRINNLNLLATGVGYTAGATITIASPASGSASIQATGYAVTNSIGQIVSIGITSQGYGYTSLNPSVSIAGVNGFGSQAVISSVTIYDSIYSVNILSAGIATTSAISINVSGNASLSPSFLYNVTSLSIANPGFGYTSNPQVSINGLSTLATATVNYGSIQTAIILNSNITFPLSLSPVVSLSGGAGTNWTGIFNTSSISFSTGYNITYSGTILNSINVTGGGQGFTTIPLISFSTSINGPAYYPELQFILSDDPTLYGSYGSIYDIKSFNSKLFFTSSTKDIIELDYNNNGMFNAIRRNLLNSTNNFNSLTPYALAVYNNNLYFSTKDKPFIGIVHQASYKSIFATYQDNILLFKPYNFDILSDWQLSKILNIGGICTATYGDINNNTLLISNQNAQIFYSSTKNNTWFNRCSISNSYLVTFNFEANYGTQSVEIATFNSTLKIAFTLNTNSLQISFGNITYNYVQIPLNLPGIPYNISMVNNNGNIYIYNSGIIVYQQNNFIPSINSYPIIKFGYIFEPQQIVTTNGQTQNIFVLPDSINPSQFIWHVISFSFNINDLVLNSNTYELNLPYVLPNVSSVRVLKTLNNNLYAVTKSLTDTRTTTNISDLSSKVYQLSGNIWNDVTGNFMSTNLGINTSYIIASPNDINALNDSYFITGLVKSTTNTSVSQDTITLGLSTNIIFEEQNLLLTIIYPYNPYPAGAFLTISDSNGLLNPPANSYFAPTGGIVNVVSIGVGTTNMVGLTTLSVSDGITASSISASIVPIGILTIGLNIASFVNYSVDVVSANVQLQATPKENRTFNLTSSQPLILSIPNSGFATILAGNIGTTIPLSVGVATTSVANLNITASYRSSVSTASILAVPFILSAGFNTSSFYGEELYTQIYSIFSVQRAPLGSLTVKQSSGLSTILSTPSFSTIAPSTLSTTLHLTSAGFVTSNTLVNITGIATGGIATGQVTAYPYSISTIMSNYNRLILGLQTATITYTLSTTPATNIIVYNIIQNPMGVSMIYSVSTAVISGGLTTSFAISTSLQNQNTNLTITIQGAPNGYNTSPTPGLAITSDIIRITNFTVTPSSIVGGGGQVNGLPQSFIANVGLNYSAIGFATTAQLTSNSTYVNFGTSLLFFYGSANSTGFATGFTTSVTAGVAMTATILVGGGSSSVYGLTLNPFLISSFTTSYAYGNIVGGLGATVLGNISLNAYALSQTGMQTLRFTSLSTSIFIYGQAYANQILGYATVFVGSISTSISIGANPVVSTISTNITAVITSSATQGIATTTININPSPPYSLIFNPLFVGVPYQYNVNLIYSIPVSAGMAVTFSNGQSQFTNIPPNQLGVVTQLNFNTFSFDTSYTAQATLLGSVQTYNVIGYAKSGGPFGMGYNIDGDLSYNYPVIGPGVGSYSKVYMGLPNVAKIVSGYHHSIALDVNGNVWGIGDNSFGQLGYNNPSSITTNAFVSIPFAYQATNIFAQNNSSYVLLANNNLYSFGDNTNNSLGSSLIVYPATAQTYIPQLISTSVEYCSVYNYRGTIVTYINTTGIQSVYEFGNNLTGIVGKGITQLGSQANASNTYNISSLNITGLNVGPQHTVAVGIWSWATGLFAGVNSSGVFAWGQNTYGQIGLTPNNPSTITTPNVLYQYNSGLVPLGYTTLIIADYNLILVVGLANTLYQYGSLLSQNNTGTGLAQTSIATPFTGFASTSSIYKLAKDSNHYIWTLGAGSVYVSGGAASGTFINVYTSILPPNDPYFPNEVAYFDQNLDENLVYTNNAGIHTVLAPQTGYSCIPGGSSGGADLNWITMGLGVIVAYVFTGVNKNLQQPPTYSGTTNITSKFGWSALLSFGEYIILQYTNYSSISASNKYAATGALYASDITISIDGAPPLSGNYSQTNVFVLTTSASTFIIYQLLCNSLITGAPIFPSLNNYTFNWTTNYPVLIDSSYLTNFVGSTYQYNSNTYNWQNSSYNFALGYQGGKVELYGNAYSFGNGSSPVGSSYAPTLIGNWFVDTTVTALQSIQNNASPNNIYLFVATQSGNLYVYNGNGGGSAGTYYSQSTSLPPLISQINIGSVYGYIQHIQHYTPGSIIASTSNNYLLVISSASLTITSAILVPAPITSITYSNVSFTGYLGTIFVSTYGSAGNPYYGTVYAYAVNLTPNYEIGLNFANQAGVYQLMTYNGAQLGQGVSNIFSASTNDTFTIILDSARPTGIY